MKVLIENFIEILKRHEKMTNVFNPWKDFDETYDLDNNAVKIRCQNLKKLSYIKKKCKICFNCRSTGISRMSFFRNSHDF